MHSEALVAAQAPFWGCHSFSMLLGRAKREEWLLVLEKDAMRGAEQRADDGFLMNPRWVVRRWGAEGALWGLVITRPCWWFSLLFIAALHQILVFFSLLSAFCLTLSSVQCISVSIAPRSLPHCSSVCSRVLLSDIKPLGFSLGCVYLSVVYSRLSESTMLRAFWRSWKSWKLKL